MFPLVVGSVSFLIVFAVVGAASFALHSRVRKTEQRLLARLIQPAADCSAPPPAVLIKDAGQQRGSADMQARVQGIAFFRNLIERAGETSPVISVLRLCGTFGSVAALFFTCFSSGSWRFCAPVIFSLGAMLPIWRLARKARNRLAAFEAQFPDGLEFIARSMRAGHAFSVSLEMLYQEFDQPMAGEFRRTFEEQNLGLPLEDALGKFAQRIPLMDVKFFASAVLLQRKTGGNLTEILDNLAHLIRERYQLRGKIRAISAHGRMTGKALSAIPVFVGVLMFFMNKDYVAFFIGTTTGNEMIAACIGLQITGYLVIQRIVNIEV